MDRRSFLNWVGIGVLANSLPAAIVACGDSPTNLSARDIESEATNKIANINNFRMIGTSSELEKMGFILYTNIVDKPIMVFRHPETRELIAINPKCTHQQCDVAIDAEQNILVCPCHDSYFSFEGEVLKGPARQPLDVYPVEQNGYVIVVNIGEDNGL